MSDIEEPNSPAHDILQHEPSGEVKALPEDEDMRMDSENSRLTDVDIEHNDDSPESSKKVNIQYPESPEGSKDFDTNRRTSLHVEEIGSHDLREVGLWLTAQKAPESTPTDGGNDSRTMFQPPQEMPETINPYKSPTGDGIHGDEELAETAVDGAAGLPRPDAPEAPTGEPPIEDATEDDNRKSPLASLADVLASLENQNAMTRRASVKSVATPNLATIDEVSEVLTPEIRGTPLRHDHAATGIAEAQTVYGHTILLDVEHSEDDAVPRIEEEPMMGSDDADERPDIQQWQHSPEVEIQDLSVEDMEQSYKAPSDEPEDRGSLGSSMEESLPGSGDVIAQEHDATDEVPDSQHPNAESIIVPGSHGQNERADTSLVSSRSPVREDLNAVHTSFPEQAAPKDSAPVSPISPLDITHFFEESQMQMSPPASPYQKPTLPVPVAPSPSVSWPPKSAKEDMNNVHLHSLSQHQASLVQPTEESVTTPDPGSPSRPPSPSPTAPPFVDTPPCLEPVLPQIEVETYGLDTYDPSKAAAGLSSEPVESQIEHKQPALAPAEALPDKIVLSPGTMNFLASLQLPPSDNHQRPEHTTYQSSPRPPLPPPERHRHLQDHLHQDHHHRPYPSNLLDSYRPSTTPSYLSHPVHSVATTAAAIAAAATAAAAAAATQEAWTHTLSSPLLVRHAFLGNLPRPHHSSFSSSRATVPPPPPPPPETHTLTHPLCPHRSLRLARIYHAIPICPACRGAATVYVPWSSRRGGGRSRSRKTECRACAGSGRVRRYGGGGVSGGRFARFARAEGPRAGAVGGMVEGRGVEVVPTTTMGSTPGCDDDGDGACERGEAWRVGDWGELVDEVVEAMMRWVGEREGWDRLSSIGERRCRREVGRLLMMGREGERMRERRAEEKKEKGMVRKRVEYEEGPRKKRKVDVESGGV